MSAYRNDLDALEARRDALAHEVEAKRRELDVAARLVEESKAQARLPVLDNLGVAAPCSQSWTAMAGDARVRHCGSCDQRVYDLSELTRAEAQDLIVAHEGRLCVRYFQRADGTILLKDCSIGVQRRRRRRVVAAGVVALLASGAAGVLALRARGGGATVDTGASAARCAGGSESTTADEVEAWKEAQRRANEEAFMAAQAGDHVMGAVTRSGLYDSDATELEAQTRELHAAVADAEAERARARAERGATVTRTQAALAAAQAATAAAAQAQRERGEAERELEAARARTRALEARLAHSHADELEP